MHETCCLSVVVELAESPACPLAEAFRLHLHVRVHDTQGVEMVLVGTHVVLGDRHHRPDKTVEGLARLPAPAVEEVLNRRGEGRHLDETRQRGHRLDRRAGKHGRARELEILMAS